MIAASIDLVLRRKATALITRDGALLGDLIDPSFVYVNASGKMFDKTSYIATYCTSGAVVFVSQKTDLLQVREFAGFVVATMQLNDTFVIGERTISKTFRSLCVFHGTAQGWLWAAGQTMPS